MSKTSERLAEAERRIKRLELAVAAQATMSIVLPTIAPHFWPANEVRHELYEEVERELLGLKKEAEADAGCK